MHSAAFLTNVEWCASCLRKFTAQLSCELFCICLSWVPETVTRDVCEASAAALQTRDRSNKSWKLDSSNGLPTMRCKQD